jgi:spore coat protein U-like protein
LHFLAPRKEIEMTKHLLHRRVASALAAVATLALATSALAATATSNFNVTASVTNNCTITSTTLAFGAYDPIVANATTPLDAAGSVDITCTKGAATTIGLSAGNNSASATTTTRAMSNGAGGFLDYEIYSNAGRTTVWTNSGAGLLTPPVAPSKATRSFPTYGRVPAGLDPDTGSYTDTVTATVNF